MNDLTEAQPVVTTDQGDDGDDHLGHYWCCDEGKALCGSDLSDSYEIESDDAIDCVVCVALSNPRVPCSPQCQRM